MPVSILHHPVCISNDFWVLCSSVGNCWLDLTTTKWISLAFRSYEMCILLLPSRPTDFLPQFQMIFWTVVSRITLHSDSSEPGCENAECRPHCVGISSEVLLACKAEIAAEAAAKRYLVLPLETLQKLVGLQDSLLAYNFCVLLAGYCRVSFAFVVCAQRKEVRETCKSAFSALGMELRLAGCRAGCCLLALKFDIVCLLVFLFVFSFMCACTELMVLWLRTLYKLGVTVWYWNGNLVEIS